MPGHPIVVITGASAGVGKATVHTIYGTRCRAILGLTAALTGRAVAGAGSTMTGPFRRNPWGRWGLRAISWSRFVGDERASPSSSLLDFASQAPSAMEKLFYETQHEAFRNWGGG